MNGYGNNNHGIPANYTTRQAQPSLYGPNPQAGQPALAQNLPAAPPPRPPVPTMQPQVAGRGGPTPNVGILAQGETQNGQANIGGILSGPARRDQTPLSTPNLRIGANEAMMRIGGAGVRASQNGGLEAIGAMTDQLGAIEDTNRSTALAEYQAAMEAEASKEKPEDYSAEISQLDMSMYDFDRALSELRGGATVTGLFDNGIMQWFDSALGHEDANTRLLLKQLRVDDTLQRISQTKGAISNKEMELFLSPAPSLNVDEKIWIKWLEDRKFALSMIRRRLADGSQVDDPATPEQFAEYRSKSNPVQFELSPEQQKLVDANS